MLDMLDVQAIRIPVEDTHYYRQVEYLDTNASNPSITAKYTLAELLNGNTIAVVVDNVRGGSISANPGDFGGQLIAIAGYDGGYPGFEIGFKNYEEDNVVTDTKFTYTIWEAGVASPSVIIQTSVDYTHKFQVALILGTIGNADTSLSIIDMTLNSEIIHVDNLTLPSGLSSLTNPAIEILGRSGSYYLKLYQIYAEIDNAIYEELPGQDKLYTNGTLWNDENGSGQMFWDNKIHDIVNVNYAGGSKCGLTVNENPGWSHTFIEYPYVVKIEDYYNGQLRQIWPCYSEGPTNPNPPVVTNAFDYDDNITWTVGTGIENSAGYYYYPITATGQANGVEIAVADNPSGWNSDGKPTGSTTYTWKIQAERAGYYQMVMSAKMSSADHITTGHWSYANIQVNGSDSGVLKLDLYGDTPDFTNTEYNDVVVAIVPLSGYEDSVTFQQSSWRIIVDPSSNIIFREIDGTSPAYLTLDTTNVTTEFTQGDTFSYSGLVVTQTLANGTTSTVSSGYTVSTPDMSTTGTKTVTVTYGALTATYDILVSASGAAWVTTATLTNRDNLSFEQGRCGGADAVRIPILNISSGGYGSDGRVSSTGTVEVYKITPPSAGDYMLVLPIRKGSGNPQWSINYGSSFTVSISNTVYEYIEILYPITLTAGENTLAIQNSSYRCYFDTTDNVYLIKSSTNPLS